jgi:glycosyltransferase involved in cell wall biosynthesis
MYNNLNYFHNKEDFDVVVLQPKTDRRFEDDLLKDGINCYYYKILSLFNNKLVQFLDFNPFFILKFLKIIKKHQINIIHVDYVFGINIIRFLTKIPIVYNAYNVETIYYGTIVPQQKNIPFILRKIYPNLIYCLEKKAVKKANLVNAMSEDDKKIFITMFDLKGKISVNRPGYKKKIFQNPIEKIVARDQLGLKRDKFIVIFHGFYFLNYANKEAIDIIKDQIAPKIEDDEILFLIAGKTPDFENKDNLRFLGYVNDLKNFLYAADVALVPIFRGSGVRIKMIDYLSARLPMITTKEATLGLVFENYIHGIIVDEENPIGDIIKKIIYLKQNPNLLNKFKENIKKLLEKEYNWKKINTSLDRKYKKLFFDRMKNKNS